MQGAFSRAKAFVSRVLAELVTDESSLDFSRKWKIISEAYTHLLWQEHSKVLPAIVGKHSVKVLRR